MISENQNLNSLQGNASVLEHIDNTHKQESDSDNNYDFLKSELHKFRELELSIWYHLISPISNEEKVKAIFQAMRSNLVGRCTT